MNDKAKRGKKVAGSGAEKPGDGRARPPDSRAQRGKSAEGSRSAATPTGPDRVLLFADSVQEKRNQEEEARHEWETWVTCRVAGETFALPVRQVQEILRVTELTRVPHAPYPVRGVTNMRGYVLPVVDLRMRLGLPEQEIGALHRVMVLSSRGRLVGLLVDGVDQVVRLDRLAVEPAPEDVMTEQSYYLMGVYRLQDHLLILLDTDKVLQVRDVDDAALAGKTSGG